MLYQWLWRAQAFWLDHKVMILSMILVIASSFNYVLYMRLMKQMGDHALVMSLFIYPVAFTVVVAILSLLLYRDRIIQLRGLWPSADELGRNLDTDTNVDRYPNEHFSLRKHWKIITILAAIDTAIGLAGMLPVLYLPAMIMLVMAQINLPLNIFLSRLLLKSSYHKIHYLSACSIVISVLTASYGSGMEVITSSNKPVKMVIFWSIWLFGVILVANYLSIYKERKLKEVNLKPWHTMVWVSVIQLPLSLLSIFIVLLPLPNPFATVEWSELGAFIQNGWLCLANQSTPTRHCENDNNMLLFCMFLIINIVDNIAAITLVKLRSVNFTITTSIIKLGVSGILLAIEPLSGAAYQMVTFLHIVGSLGIVIGVLLYYSQPREEMQVRSIISADDNEDDQRM